MKSVRCRSNGFVSLRRREPWQFQFACLLLLRAPPPVPPSPGGWRQRLLRALSASACSGCWSCRRPPVPPARGGGANRASGPVGLAWWFSPVRLSPAAAPLRPGAGATAFAGPAAASCPCRCRFWFRQRHRPSAPASPVPGGNGSFGACRAWAPGRSRRPLRGQCWRNARSGVRRLLKWIPDFAFRVVFAPASPVQAGASTFQCF